MEITQEIPSEGPELSKPHMSVLIGFTAIALVFEVVMIVGTAWAV